MSQVDVKILYQDYTLACPEGQEAMLHEAVERVDTHLSHLRDAGKLRSRERGAVLLSVQLAYENLELRSQLHALQAQITQWQSDPLNADGPLDRADTADAGAMHADTATAHALIARIDHALLATAALNDDGSDESVPNFALVVPAMASSALDAEDEAAINHPTEVELETPAATPEADADAELEDTVTTGDLPTATDAPASDDAATDTAAEVTGAIDAFATAANSSNEQPHAGISYGAAHNATEPPITDFAAGVQLPPSIDTEGCGDTLQHRAESL